MIFRKLLGILLLRRNKRIEQDLIGLGYKTIKNEDGTEITFESDALNGFELRGIFRYCNELRPEIEINLYMQEKQSDDITSEWLIHIGFYPIKKSMPYLKSITDNFKKYCGNSAKPAIDYNFEELMALDEKITGNTYKSIKI
jgi:hypothetical protein